VLIFFVYFCVGQNREKRERKIRIKKLFFKAFLKKISMTKKNGKQKFSIKKFFIKAQKKIIPIIRKRTQKK